MSLPLRLVWVVPLAAAAVGCSSPKGEPPPPPPEPVRTTYRALAGISGGAISTGAIGFRHPDRFDGLGMLGGPMDGAYFLRSLDRYHVAGFCPLAKLEALAAQDPNRLNDPAEIARCAPERPPPLPFERVRDFNAWPVGGNQEMFDRWMFVRMFTDLTLAHGNLFTENPASAFAPVGVDPSHVRSPPADFCERPVRVPRLFNAEFNPAGKYDAITFCDGQPRLFFCRATGAAVDFCADPRNVAQPLSGSGVDSYAGELCRDQGGAEEARPGRDDAFILAHGGKVVPCVRPTEPVAVLLAYDLNGNGRRDYGEPVVNNGQERFDDLGKDGCGSALEDGQGGCSGRAASGDPNGDDYDPLANPFGTEGNWLREEGEPFGDHGLDGVPGTLDFGEGNARFDLSSGRRSLLAHDPRQNLLALPEASRARFHVLIDGGIRDVVNFGVMAQQLFGAVKALRPSATLYRDFTDIPGMTDRRTGTYNPWNARWRTVPHDLFLFYGKEDATLEEVIAGDGEHVGTNTQAVYRFYTLFNWAAALWPELARPATPSGQPVSERQRLTWFDSKALGAKREFGLVLPPGYDLPENQQARYPVLYFVPGYGTKVKDMMAISLIADAYMQDTDVKLRPMILVFPSIQCCYRHPTTGQRDCRERDDFGEPLSWQGWKRECNNSVFNLNARGMQAGEGAKYEDAFLELMEHVDRQYRTLPAADVPARSSP